MGIGERERRRERITSKRFSQSSTILSLPAVAAKREGWVAALVDRNGQENGGEDRYASNPLQRQVLEKKEVCQL